MSAARGLALVLHAHLPWVRHPEYDRFVEEEWLFEAIAEAYVPLLRVLCDLADAGREVPLTLGITPPLLEMLSDPILVGRARRYCSERHDLCARLRRDPACAAWEPALAGLEAMYGQALSTLARVRDALVPAFGDLQDRGALDIVASGATHAVLPLLCTPEGQRAQVKVGVETYNRHFGRFPRGFWLPECAWAEGVDKLLRGVAQKWTIVDAPGIERSVPVPRAGTATGVRTPADLLVFGRDRELSALVGGRHQGFAADALYREFYRDAGDELPEAELAPLLGAGAPRRWIGLKLWARTGPVPLAEKRPYDPRAAEHKARQHAEDFVRAAVARFERVGGGDAILVAPFDAELFGHWWFEGPHFLRAVLDRLTGPDAPIPLTTPSAWVGQHGESAPRARPAPSSWGTGGTFELWCQPEHEGFWRHLHRNEERLVAAATRFHHERNPHRRVRLLNQAARELLVAQGSDWTFMLGAGRGASSFAWRTLTEHLARCAALLTEVEGGDPLPRGRLEAWEEADNVFPDVRWTNWSRATHTGEWEPAALPGVL